MAEAIPARIGGVVEGLSAAGFDGPDLQRFVAVIRGRAGALVELGRERTRTGGRPL